MAYSLGLGVPFVLSALGLRRVLASREMARRHARTVVRVGGVLLILTGVALVTGLWNVLTVQMRVWSSGFTLPI